MSNLVFIGEDICSGIILHVRRIKLGGVPWMNIDRLLIPSRMRQRLIRSGGAWLIIVRSDILIEILVYRALSFGCQSFAASLPCILIFGRHEHLVLWVSHIGLTLCIDVMCVLPGIMVDRLLSERTKVLSSYLAAAKLDWLTNLGVWLLLNSLDIHIMAISELWVDINVNRWTLSHLWGWYCLGVTVVSISCGGSSTWAWLCLGVLSLRGWFQNAIWVNWDRCRIVNWRSIDICLWLR